MITKHNTNKYFYSSVRKLILKDFPPSYAQLKKAYKLIRIVLKGERKRLKTQSENSIPIPYSCVFSVTWHCNLKCVGCYSRHYPSENQLTTAEVEKTIDEAILLGVYIFIIVGGEPLIMKDIIGILSKRKKAMFFLFTNGTLLDNEKVIQLKKADNIIPVVSAEGSSEFVETRRGEGMGNTVYNAFTLLKKNRVTFGFASMITHKNLNEVLSVDWINSLCSYGAKFGFIIDYIPFPKTLDTSLILSSEEISFKRMAIAEINRKAKITVFNFPEDEYRRNGCKSAGNGFIHINANGNVEPCPFSHFAADNIRNKSILEILDSDFFKCIRKSFQNKQNDHKGCMLFYNNDIVEEIASMTNAVSTEKQQ